MKPIIALTMGDPAGIGPEIARKALARRDVQSAATVVLIGNPHDAKRVPTGKPSVLGGKISGENIKKAVDLVQLGFVDAIVTGPINKVSFRLGGWGKKFVGHTEMLAALAGVKTVRSMLLVDKLRAVHVTSHIPLRRVAGALSVKKIVETIFLANDGLKKMGIKKPKIAVAGLNPHAGDGGILGTEERRFIKPAVLLCRRRKINVEGPLSADALWPLVRAGVYDVGVAMYHDQGQIAVKLAGFDIDRKSRTIHGVQVTLGLPFVRTSVDHGTAYDLAGKGKASPESLVEAIKLAARMAKNHA